MEWGDAAGGGGEANGGSGIAIESGRALQVNGFRDIGFNSGQAKVG